MIEGITPHPVLLPQGEGTVRQAPSVIQASFSLWEKDRMRGNALSSSRHGSNGRSHD